MGSGAVGLNNWDSQCGIIREAQSSYCNEHVPRQMHMPKYMQQLYRSQDGIASSATPGRHFKVPETLTKMSVPPNPENHVFRAQSFIFSSEGPSLNIL